ncbi:MAG: endonuclease III, partial [Akkermansia sp.]|nr:endonuclease III [Akkermansia sp.]
MADFDAILQGLKALYPDAGPELNFTNPYETLVATILSAQCTDKRVNMVTPAVFRDFPDPAAMAQTTPEILFPYVKSCGFTS